MARNGVVVDGSMEAQQAWGCLYSSALLVPGADEQHISGKLATMHSREKERERERERYIESV